jgi:hypothetical protein
MHKIAACVNFFWIEGVAKLALEAKFDDFDFGCTFRKLTYLAGDRQFAKSATKVKSADLAPNWSFAAPSTTS